MALAALTAVVTVFRLQLLWLRATDGTLRQPGVVLEWVVAMLLLLVALRAHRAGISLFRGRRALAFWLIVVLLHAVAVGPQTDGSDGPSAFRINTELLVLAPFGVALAVALSRGLQGLGWIRRRRILPSAERRHQIGIGMVVKPQSCLPGPLIPRAPPA
jgi:hypothetical protein